MREKIAIITGGAGDIGQAITIKFCENSIKCVIIDIDKSNGAKTTKLAEEKGFLVHYIYSDISNYTAANQVVNEIIQNIGDPSILINCAGIIRDSTINNMQETDFDDVININLKGTFNYIKAVTPVFKKNLYGKIVNISSINALRGKFGQCNYSASKAGVIGLSKSIAIELGKYNVNVNVVAPGMILTSMTNKLPINIIKRAIEESLLGKIGEPDDVAELVYFLVSEKAKHITGEVIKIDGGQYL